MTDHLKLLTDFVGGFTSKDIFSEGKIIELNKNFYLVDEKLEEIMNNSDLEPFSAGVFLGNVKDNEFKPSLALLDMIAKHSGKKVFTDSEGETHFLYGKDLFAKAVKKSNVKDGIVLVQNENDENIGYGMLSKDGVKNILDRGDFIRRDVMG